MEADLGNFADARSIFERSLKLFRSPSAEKTAVWRAYEVMEERGGNSREAQLVFQRSMRESMTPSLGKGSDGIPRTSSDGASMLLPTDREKKSAQSDKEVARWGTRSN